MWVGGCQQKSVQREILEFVEAGLKIVVLVSATTIKKGIVERVGVHSKNFAIV